MQTNEQQLDLARQVAWLKDYVILDRKDYEKLVYNRKCTRYNTGVKRRIKYIK